MTKREAACSCGQLGLTVEGDPVRISICHCLSCQRRTGSAFGVQARFHQDQVTARHGTATSHTRVADSGNPMVFGFCGTCGSTLWWQLHGMAEFLVVPVGAFADPTFPQPQMSIYDDRKHAWALGDIALEHMA